jgi:Zn-finger nucleic acid-binding protein
LLDRGELDKIIERAQMVMGISNNSHNQINNDCNYKNYEFQKHHKRGLLGELFD